VTAVGRLATIAGAFAAHIFSASVTSPPCEFKMTVRIGKIDVVAKCKVNQSIVVSRLDISLE
jgi:hypothetical protein